MKKIFFLLVFGLFAVSAFSQTVRTRSYFHNLYITGYKPTQTNYRDLWVSVFWPNEDTLTLTQLVGVDGTLSTDATLSTASNRQISSTLALKTYIDAATAAAGVNSFNGRTGTVVPASNDYQANQVTFTPITGIVATNVQSAIAELQAEKADTARAAGGDLSGTLTTLQLGTGVVGSTELASTGVVAGTYGNSTNYPQVTVDADGRITTITNQSFTGLTDGDKVDIDVSASGATWTVDTSAITTIKIAASAVDSTKIATGGIGNTDYAALSITGSKIAASTIDSTKIATGGIGNTDYAALSITGSKIANSTIDSTKIATGGIGNTDLASAIITWAKLAQAVKDSINTRPYPKIAKVIVINGQSNALGLGSNASASAPELAAQATVKIWNPTTRKWEALDVGTNNQANSSSEHGLELGFAAQYANYLKCDTLYIIKQGIGSTKIETWTPGGANYDKWENRYLAAGLDALRWQGKQPEVYFVWIQGDANGTSAADTLTFRTALQAWKYNYNTVLGGKLPILVPSIYPSSALTASINRTYNDYSLRQPYFKYVSTTDSLASQHYTYQEYKTAARRLLSKMKQYEGLKPDRFIIGEKDVDITSFQYNGCVSGTYSYTVGVRYSLLTDSLYFVDNGTTRARKVYGIYGDTSITITGISCSLGTPHTLKVYGKDDPKIYDATTYVEQVVYTDSVSYDFEGYSVPTLDTITFQDWKGTNIINTVAGSKRLLPYASTPVDTTCYARSGAMRFTAVPYTATDVSIQFSLTYASAGSVLYLLANPSTTGPISYALRFAGGGIVVTSANGTSETATSIGTLSSTFSAGTTYTIKCVLTGSTLEAFVGGTSIGTLTLSPSYAVGSIVYASNSTVSNGDGNLDNIIIKWKL